MNNDDGSNWEWVRDYLSAITKAIWLVLSSTCHFLTDNSLQSADKDQQEMRSVAEKPHDAVVKNSIGLRIEMYSGIARCSLRQCGILFTFRSIFYYHRSWEPSMHSSQIFECSRRGGNDPFQIHYAYTRPVLWEWPVRSCVPNWKSLVLLVVKDMPNCLGVSGHVILAMPILWEWLGRSYALFLLILDMGVPNFLWSCDLDHVPFQIQKH